MKYKPILFALLGVCVLSAANVVPIIDDQPIFDSDITLSKFTGEENLVLPVTITKFSSTAYKLIVSIYNAVSGNKLYTKTYLGSEIGTSLPVKFDIALPIKNRLRTDGLRIAFEHYLKKEIYYSDEAIIYPYQKKYVNISGFRKEPYISKGNYLKIVDHKVYTDEVFNFTNLNEFLTVETNNKLDFSSVVFKYDSFDPFFCNHITLHIKDHNNVFPYLQTSNQMVTLKMKYTQIEDDIYLDLDEQLYVNKYTLEMARDPMSNFIETNSLFIPSNKEDEFMGDEVEIKLFDIGYSEVDFTMPFNFYFSKKYVGECYESDYCIHGGIKE